GFGRSPPSAERPRPALPLARLRADRLLECRASRGSLDAGRQDRSIESASALSSAPLDGARRWMETGALRRRPGAGHSTHIRLLAVCPTTTLFPRMIVSGRRYPHRLFGLVVPTLEKSVLSGEAPGAG